MKAKYQSIRVFQSPFLEIFTHVHPIIPLVMWTPIISWLFYSSFVELELPLSNFLWIFPAALLTWSLCEYIMHRFVFHFPAKSELGKRLIFIFHGLHHDDPNDPTRLVMPPLPGLILGSAFYVIFSLFLPHQTLDAFMASFLIGYLLYDYIHYGTHHFKMKGKVSRYLKKFHLQHHHSHHPEKYGVSSPLWDYVFRTKGK